MIFEEQDYISINSILERVTEEEIIYKYLGTTPVERKKFNNPYRKDKSPSVSFKLKPNLLGTEWLITDFSGWCSGSIFNWVGKIYGISFKEALAKVYYEFNLNSVPPKYKIESKVPQETTLTSIEVIKQPFTKVDIDYWNQYHITEEVLNFYNVSSLKYAKIKKFFYYYNNYNPGYVYDFLEEDYKLYFPLDRTGYRFLGNIPKNTHKIQGFSQLTPVHILKDKTIVITKSLKDVMCFRTFNIESIAVNAESVLLPDFIMDFIIYSYDRIILNMDYDGAGIRLMNKFKNKYPKVFSIPQYNNILAFKKYSKGKNEIKDFADFCKFSSKDEVKIFLDSLQNKVHYINER